MSMCICDQCYYGRKCQFTTKGFILSLDAILGYQIKPNVTISRQPTIIKLSIGIITFMYIFGLISALLSILTFRMKQPREVGCGWYLLASSIVSICTLTLLNIKFWNLILAQKG